MNMKNNTFVQKSSGNVFADTGMQNPDQEQLKAGLTLQIYHLIKSRKLTQTQVGEVLGIERSQVSALMRNRSGNFSVKRLKGFLGILGREVEINARQTSKCKKSGEVSVQVQG